MSKSVMAGNLWTVLAVILIPAVLASAQQTKKGTPDSAPVPVQIAKAKSVFVSNAGADVVGSPYSGGVDRPYNQFYAEMKSWGRYELTPAPAGSDLIFELSFTTQVVLAHERDTIGDGIARSSNPDHPAAHPDFTAL